MSSSFAGETKKIAVSQCEVTNNTREVLTKHLKAGQETVAATEPRKRDGGSLETITAGSSFHFGTLYKRFEELRYHVFLARIKHQCGFDQMLGRSSEAFLRE